MFPKFTSGDWRSIVLADSGSDRDNYLWIILLKRKRYLKIYLIQEFLLHKFTVHNNKSSQTLMAVCLDYQPIRRVENSSSGSMDKTNQSDFVTTRWPSLMFKTYNIQTTSRLLSLSLLESAELTKYRNHIFITSNIKSMYLPVLVTTAVTVWIINS